MNYKYKKILPFLQDNKYLIDNNMFEKVYENLLIDDRLIFDDTGLLTELFLEAQINPLVYMSNIPTHFMHGTNSEISQIEIPQNIQSIDEYAFITSYISDIFIPRNVKELKAFAIASCSKLKQVIFEEGNSLKVIPHNCFFEDICLESVSIPDSVKILSPSAFRNCFRLKTIKLSKNLTVIDYHCFVNCFSLQEIVIPSTIQEIDERAFRNCDNLKKIIFESDASNISLDMFYSNKNLTDIYYNGFIDFAKNFTENDLYIDHKITFHAKDGDISYGPNV